MPKEESHAPRLPDFPADRFALFSACATLLPPPKTISVTEVRLAQMIASQFPFNSEMLEVLDVVVSTPRISLDPTNNRINTSLDINVAGNNLLGLFTDKQYKGALDMSYGLRFEPPGRDRAPDRRARASARHRWRAKRNAPTD